MGGEQPAPATGILVTEGFFQTLRVDPLAGRLFRSEEFLHNAQPVALLSYPFWKRRLGGDSSIVGAPPYIAYMFNSGKVPLSSPDGTSKEVTFKAGETNLRRDAETHAVENLGSEECHVMNIEFRDLKNPAQGVAKLSAGHQAQAEHRMIDPKDMKWQDAPPALPPGSQVAVLRRRPPARRALARFALNPRPTTRSRPTGTPKMSTSRSSPVPSGWAWATSWTNPRPPRFQPAASS